MLPLNSLWPVSPRMWMYLAHSRTEVTKLRVFFKHVREGPATLCRDRTQLALSFLPEVFHFLMIRHLFCLAMSVFTSFCADVLVLYSARGKHTDITHAFAFFRGWFFCVSGIIFCVYFRKKKKNQHAHTTLVLWCSFICNTGKGEGRY